MGTPTLRLKRLSMKAFRSFVDSAELELPESGVHLVNAPSGHGKSSLVEAIAFAFDYSQFPATEHQSWPWLTDEPMQVGLDFYVGSLPAEVRRGKKAALRIGDAPALTSAATIAKKLPEVLGLKPEMLKALTYRPQRQRGLFLSFTDSEKKSFLTDLLHLGHAEAEVDRTQKAITALEREVALAQARAEQARAGVPAEPQPPETEPLYPLDKAVATAVAAKAEAVKNLTEATDRRNALKVAQRTAASAIAATYDGPIEVKRRALDEAKGATYALDPEAAGKLEKLKARLKFIQDSMKQLRGQHLESATKLQTSLNALKQDLWRVEQRVKELPKLTQDRDALLKDIAVIEAAKCPTCEQTWTTDSAETVLERKMHEVEDLDERIEHASEYEKGLGKLRADVAQHEEDLKTARATDPVPEKFYKGEQEQQAAIGALAEQQKSAKAQFDDARGARVATLEAELRELQARRSAAVSEAMQPTQEMREAEEQTSTLLREQHEQERLRMEAQGKLDAATQRNKLLLAQYDRDEAQWKRFSDVAKAEAAKVNETAEKLNREEDFQGLLKSFLSLVFDESLQAVAAKANELLVGVPNVAGFTLDFTSERETKSGTVRQEIKPIIRKDGHEISLRSGCSGGQQAVIELATDLALAEVIAERTSIYPGWLVLDEPFDGLGPADKEACMEVLSRVAEDRAIFIIDHSAEVKELFDSVIAIKYSDGRSTFA
jgi:DNA repair exonuclease SbcCD ATPase subunit